MTTRKQFITGALASTAALYAAAVFGDTPDTGSLDLSKGAPAHTIDWHNHWLSPQSVEFLKKRTVAPRIVENSDKSLSFITDDNGGPGLKLALEFTDVDARIRQLNRVGVSRQIISWPTTLGVDAVLDAAESRELWTAYNDDLAALVKQHPDRFSGLAALPTSDIPWAAQELGRAHTRLGLLGAVLPVGAFQSREGAERLTDIFDVAQAHSSHIYLHTGPARPEIPGQITLSTPPNDARDARATLDRALTFARGAVTLTQTDFLAPYTNVTAQIAMLGGALPVLSSWLLHNPRGSQRGPGGRLFERVYVDTGVFGRSPDLVAFATRVLGTDRVLFGSDFPLALTEKTLVALNQSTLSDTDKRQILVDNGQNLYAKVTATA
jgi:predicted TIM-barrel fold metal-dependent hydrolase